MSSAVRLATAAALVALHAAPSLALVISTNFDSTVTSQSNAAQIEAAFSQATNAVDSLLVNPVTVNLNVSWGSIQGQSLPSNALGTSSTSLYGYYSYAQMTSMLKASSKTAADRSAYATLPASAPAGETRYVITSAQAKALGAVAPTSSSLDGAIGFGASPYDFNPGDGITPGTYDFIAVAEHEITEVLGRISGLSTASPSYATALDLFRYAGTAARSFAYNTSSYFSIDNGQTDLANFNHSSSGGDRGDWLSSTTTTDVADAFTYAGTHGVLSALDQTALDVVGWGSTGTGSGGASAVSTAKGAADAASAPEPASLALLGAGVVAWGLRRKRR